jgi:hypothetical protein
MLTSRPLSKAQVRQFLTMFNFSRITEIFTTLATSETHRIDSVYGTPITIRYVPDGNRYYVTLAEKRKGE